MRAWRWLAGALALALAGCGSSASSSSSGTRSTSVPAYVEEPFTHQQELIAAGARLIVSDGCSACHLDAASSNAAPSFMSFAGHTVTLANGHRALVNEQFLRESLVDPAKDAIRGYALAPMLRAVARLQLAHRPQQVAELAAFIEEIGPEPQ